MLWKVSLDEQKLVDGFFPSDYRGVLPQSRLITVDEDEYVRILKIMPAQYVEGEGFKRWSPPPPPLEELKTAKFNALRAAFDERVSGTIDAHDYQMQFDISDALKMQGAIQLLETTGATEGYLTLANDETVYNVPLEVMKAVFVDMLSAYAACHARKQEIRARINAAQTKEELDAIQITWPL